jgi:hypothetical protein
MAQDHTTVGIINWWYDVRILVEAAHRLIELADCDALGVLSLDFGLNSTRCDT